MATISYPLDLQEFERALSLGLGRAILHLQKHDAAPCQDAILRCCLHNTAYDTQVEGNRSDYLFEVIQLTKNLDFYRKSILDALNAASPSDENSRDAEHRMALAMQLVAENNDTEALQVMYQTYLRFFESERDFGVYHLLVADGVNAFLFLLDPHKTGQYPPKEDASDFGYLLDSLEDDLGKEQVRQTLDAAASENVALRELLDAIYTVKEQHAERRETKSNKTTSEPKQSYAEIKPFFDGKPSGFSRWTNWAINATEEDFKLAAFDFTMEDNARNLQKYLYLFRVRPFPLDDYSKLFSLATRDESDQPYYERVARRAITALNEIQHPCVRQFALDSIGKRIDTGAMVGILQKNFEVGDWLLIQQLAQDLNSDRDETHSLGLSVRDIFKQHPSPDAIPILLQLYEHVPCSHCRYGFVRDLVSLNAVPDWMAEESKHDAYFDLREFALNGFQDPHDHE
jgi:hypothetical protein